MPRRATADETQITARRERVAALYLAGHSQYEIGRREKVDHGTVSRDLAALRKLWQESALRDFGERQAEELAKVDRLEAESWEAWERSKLPAKITTAEKVTSGSKAAGGERTKAARRVEGRDGDPRFLQTVERCIARRCEILGLDAAKRQEVKVEATVRGSVSVSEMTDDELDAEITRLQAIEAPK